MVDKLTARISEVAKFIVDSSASMLGLGQIFDVVFSNLCIPTNHLDGRLRVSLCYGVFAATGWSRNAIPVDACEAVVVYMEIFDADSLLQRT